MTNNFGEFLKQCMCDAHISDSALAEAIRVNRQTIFRWKTHKTLPQHRDPLLRSLKSLRIQDDLAKCNQLFKLSQHPLLNAEEIKTYLKLSTEAVITPPSTQQPFQDLIQKIITNFIHSAYPTPLMLLSPEQHQPLWFFDVLLSHLAPYYKNNFFHLIPPASETLDERGYFENLTTPHKALTAFNANQFEISLKRHIKQQGKVFILVSRFEQGALQHNKVFARILRNLLEFYKKEVHLLMFGGEKLAAIKSEQGSHSLLNLMEELLWLELTAVDVLCMADELQTPIAPSVAEEILRVSGGHAYLIKLHLKLTKNYPQLSLEQQLYAIQHTHRPQSMLTIFNQLINEGFHYQLKDLLDTKGVFTTTEKPPFFMNPLLKTLYWNNLLSYQSGLQWRCATIQTIGLSCYEK